MPSSSAALNHLPALLVAVLLALLQLRAGTEFSLVDAGAIAALAYLVAAAGRLLLHAARAEELGPAAAYVLGLLATCLATYVLAVALGVTAAWALGILACGVIPVDLVLSRRWRAPTPDARALGGFGLAVALTAAWCWAPAGAYEVLRTQGLLPVWSDYYFHGGLISQFADPRALGRGSIFLVDHPASFYHYGSYGAAAALAGMQGEPGLPAATAAWLPLGFLAMLAGAQVLGTRLAGAAGGLAAILTLAVLPDASNYALRNGWFSFHFTLVAHAGAPYALGAALLSLALLERSRSERARGALVASGLLAVSTLAFRAHLFVLFVPVWIAVATLSSAEHAGRRRMLGWIAVGALGLVAAAGGLLLEHLAQQGEGHWRLAGSAVGRFLTVVHEWQEPTAYSGLYPDLVDYWHPYVALLAGVALAVIAGLGAFVVLLPVTAVLAARAGHLRPLDAVCPFLLYCWLLLMLFAPTPWHGEASDLIHRPFVLAYAAYAVWTACLALRFFAASGRSAASWWALLAAGLVALPWMPGGAERELRPKFAWGGHDAATRVPAGLVETAQYLRRSASRGDIFAVGGLGTGYATFDLATQLCSLTGMPAFLSRPYIEMLKDAPRRKLVQARIAALQEVDASADYAAALDALRRLNIQWYVVADPQGPRWDPGRRRAAIMPGAVALYRIP